MVIILGVSLRKRNRFISIRWKLVSTYLLLLVISLIIINAFISQTVLNIYLDQRKSDLLTRGNIISNNIKYYIDHDRIKRSDDYLNSTLESFSESVGARILVVDTNNVVAGDSNKEFIGRTFLHDEIKKGLNGISNSSVYNLKDYGRTLYVATPVVFADEIIGVTLISSSVDDIYGTVGTINKNLVIISILCILLIAMICFIFVGVVTRPIEGFTAAILKISRGDLDEEVKIKTNDEFNKMANAFNLMVMKLDQVDKQRKDFVANVSHELRTPLSSIKLLSESLLHQDEKDIKIYREFLQDIDAEVDRLNHIIDDLLSLVDLDKQKLNLNYKITYVNFLLEKVISRLKPLAKNKSIQLKLNAKEKVQIKLDSEKIQQAVINIIHNAIKYTPEGGEIKVHLYPEGKFVVIKIKDNGIGIPNESIPYVFDRFYRVDKARSRNTGGTGLGLSIASQVISLHQGQISVESEVGKGSTFYIKLPYNTD